MNTKSPVTTFAMLQTFLAGAGLLASRSSSPGILDKFKYYVIAIFTLSVIGTAFLLTGLFLYLSKFMQPYEVWLIIGSVILGLGLLILLSRIFVIFMIKRKIKKTIKELYEGTKAALEHVSTELKNPIIENPTMAVGLAALAGFIVISKYLDNNKS